MGTYFMFGSYSGEAIEKISADRTEEAAGIIEANGGKIKSAYALLGEYDLVLITKFPGTKEAIKASVEMSKAFGIGFSTAPAISVNTFDELVGG
jgi:uncharacterized protein with GYD domain